MIVKLTDRKAGKILNLCLLFCHKDKAFTIREVASLIGSLISSRPAVEYGRLHYRSIQTQTASTEMTTAKFIRTTY